MHFGNRRNFLAASAMGAAWHCQLSAAATRRPNIIFIITDDQGRDQFNFLPEGKRDGKGINLTPNIDRLSTEGVILRNQHVATSVCTPSRFSCLTGRCASRATNKRFLQKATKDGQTVVEWNTAITPDTPTLPKFLQEAGYFTGMVGKNHVIESVRSKRVPLDADAEDPQVLAQLEENQEAQLAACRQCGFDYAASIYGENIKANQPRVLMHHNLDWITKGALDFIDQAAGRPFFLYYATTVPHSPARDEAWKGDPLATPIGLLDKPLDVLPSRESIPQRLKKAGIDASRGDMLWLDDAVGALLKKLEERGKLDNTIIFYFNDHGIESGKGTVYQGGVLTTSFVWSRHPRMKGGRNVDTLVSNIDFAPTILDICRIHPRDATFDGRSLRPILEGRDEAVHESLYFEMGYTRAVRKGDWKYIALRTPAEMKKLTFEQRKKKLDDWVASRKRLGLRYFEADPMDPFGHLGEVPGGSDIDRAAMKGHPKHYFDTDQLYDLKKDPNEQVNLAGKPEYGAQLKEMQAELSNHLAKLPGTFAELKK